MFRLFIKIKPKTNLGYFLIFYKTTLLYLILSSIAADNYFKIDISTIKAV
jgi:hypothetical protein